MMGAMLAVKAAVPLAVIDRASKLRNAKGMIALAWKAALSMQVAVALQIVLARLPPDGVIRPTAEGSYPMTVQEMRWQLEFVCRAGR
jgi:hypothetical protein